MRPPPPPSPPTRTQQWIALLLAISLTAMAAVVIWTGFVQQASTPDHFVSASPRPSVRESSAPLFVVTWPADALTMMRAISTYVAPTPKPTPKPTLGTPAPAKPVEMVCGPGLTEGTLCTWAQATSIPTMTPSPCQTPMPYQACYWTNPGVTPIASSAIATPVATPPTLQ